MYPITSSGNYHQHPQLYGRVVAPSYPYYASRVSLTRYFPGQPATSYRAQNPVELRGSSISHYPNHQLRYTVAAAPAAAAPPPPPLLPSCTRASAVPIAQGFGSAVATRTGRYLYARDAPHCTPGAPGYLCQYRIVGHTPRGATLVMPQQFVSPNGPMPHGGSAMISGIGLPSPRSSGVPPSANFVQRVGGTMVPSTVPVGVVVDPLGRFYYQYPVIPVPIYRASQPFNLSGSAHPREQFHAAGFPLQQELIDSGNLCLHSIRSAGQPPLNVPCFCSRCNRRRMQLCRCGNIHCPYHLSWQSGMSGTMPTPTSMTTPSTVLLAPGNGSNISYNYNANAARVQQNNPFGAPHQPQQQLWVNPSMGSTVGPQAQQSLYADQGQHGLLIQNPDCPVHGSYQQRQHQHVQYNNYNVHSHSNGEHLSYQQAQQQQQQLYSQQHSITKSYNNPGSAVIAQDKRSAPPQGNFLAVLDTETIKNVELDNQPTDQVGYGEEQGYETEMEETEEENVPEDISLKFSSPLAQMRAITAGVHIFGGSFSGNVAGPLQLVGWDTHCHGPLAGKAGTKRIKVLGRQRRRACFMPRIPRHNLGSPKMPSCKSFQQKQSPDDLMDPKQVPAFIKDLIMRMMIEIITYGKQPLNIGSFTESNSNPADTQRATGMSYSAGVVGASGSSQGVQASSGQAGAAPQPYVLGCAGDRAGRGVDESAITIKMLLETPYSPRSKSTRNRELEEYQRILAEEELQRKIDEFAAKDREKQAQQDKDNNNFDGTGRFNGSL